MKGFLWYQGESNRPNPTQYRALMPAFVKMLRERAGGRASCRSTTCRSHPTAMTNADLEGGSALLREAQMHNLEAISRQRHGRNDRHRQPGTASTRQKGRGGNTPARLSWSKTLRHERLPTELAALRVDDRRGNRAYLTFRCRKSSRWHPWAMHSGFEVAGADRVFHPRQSVDREGTGDG